MRHLNLQGVRSRSILSLTCFPCPLLARRCTLSHPIPPFFLAPRSAGGPWVESKGINRVEPYKLASSQLFTLCLLRHQLLPLLSPLHKPQRNSPFPRCWELVDSMHQVLVTYASRLLRLFKAAKKCGYTN
jgi:hypothetical protein